MKKVAIILSKSKPVPPIRGGAVQNGVHEVTKYFTRYKPYVFSVSDPELPEHHTIGNVEHFHIGYSDKEKFLFNLMHLNTSPHLIYITKIAKM